MFLRSLSLFDFSDTNTGTWLSIASITMLAITFIIRQLQESQAQHKERYFLLAVFFIGISITAILLFIFDYKIWGACAIIVQLTLILVFGLIMLYFTRKLNSTKKITPSFQKENITVKDFFPNESDK